MANQQQPKHLKDLVDSVLNVLDGLSYEQKRTILKLASDAVEAGFDQRTTDQRLVDWRQRRAALGPIGSGKKTDELRSELEQMKKPPRRRK